MIKEHIDKMKDKLNKKEKENNKKTIENLVVFVVILIITIIAINYIWSGSNKKEKNNIQTNKKLAVNIDNEENKKNEENENIEIRLENILSKIKGVGNTKVLLTYSRTSQIVPLYDEDLSKSSTEEKDSGRRRKSSK